MCKTKMKYNYTLACIFLFIGAVFSPNSHSFVVNFRKPPVFSSTFCYSNQRLHIRNLESDASLLTNMTKTPKI